MLKKQDKKLAGNSYRESVSKLFNGTKITMVKGDITKQHNVDAIVNAANTTMLGGLGVDGAIHWAAGIGLFFECLLKMGCRTGKAKITNAYKIPCRYIIHTPGPHWHGGKKKERELLEKSYSSCFDLALEYGIKRIAFPSISTGGYRFPLDEAANIAITTAIKYINNYPGIFENINWVLFDDKTFCAYKDAMQKF